MKIVTLLENTTDSDDLRCAHGLSFFIESAHHMIISDFGPNDFFYFNAQRMGVPVKMVDLAVLSHGHYDHGNGIPVFLDQNEKAKLYVQKGAFDEYYGRNEAEGTKSVTYEYIGVNDNHAQNDRVVIVDGDMKIDDEVEIFSGVTARRMVSQANATLMKKISENNYEKDDFSHEQNLVIKNPDGTAVMFSGCAHSGIVNIMEEAYQRYGTSLKAVFGGFHLLNPDSDEEIDEDMVKALSIELKKYPVTYYTGHCTGHVAYELLKKLMGSQIQYCHTGFEVTI